MVAVITMRLPIDAAVPEMLLREYVTEIVERYRGEPAYAQHWSELRLDQELP